MPSSLSALAGQGCRCVHRRASLLVQEAVCGGSVISDEIIPLDLNDPGELVELFSAEPSCTRPRRVSNALCCFEMCSAGPLKASLSLAVTRFDSVAGCLASWSMFILVASSFDWPVASVCFAALFFSFLALRFAASLANCPGRLGYFFFLVIVLQLDAGSV